MYHKTKSFIMRFYDFINWDTIKFIDVKDANDIDELVFNLQIIPLRVAINKRLLDNNHIDKHYLDIVPYMLDILKTYSIRNLEKCMMFKYFKEQVFGDNVNAVYEACIKDSYVPEELISILGAADKCENGNWSDILDIYFKKATISESILEQYVVRTADKRSWEIISISVAIKLSDHFAWKHVDKLRWELMNADALQHRFEKDTWCQLVMSDWRRIPSSILCKYIKFTSDFIDENAQELDWHTMCEHQPFPEWLMRKHIDKLDWGQVSWYQAMTPEFIKDYGHRLNMVKMQYNKYTKLQNLW